MAAGGEHWRNARGTLAPGRSVGGLGTHTVLGDIIIVVICRPAWSSLIMLMLTETRHHNGTKQSTATPIGDLESHMWIKQGNNKSHLH